MSEARRSAPALEVKGLDVYYGHSHALQGVDLTLDSGVFSVVGRNGMGKTTLCKAIMGLVRGQRRLGPHPRRGSHRAAARPGSRASASATSRRAGGCGARSASTSISQLAAGMRRGPWTIERIYETFPRLAERKDHGGSQLSGGEQQMLAISRALLTNPHLLIMDEPTEGLAPVIVAQVEEMLVRLGEDGDMSVLVIEQNIGVATADLPERRHHGQWPRQPHHRLRAACRRSRPATAPAWRRAPRRPRAPTSKRARQGQKPAKRRSPHGARARCGSSSPIPTLPTRWSQPVPIARIEAAARTVSTGVTRLDEVARQRREPATTQTSGPPVVLVVGTLDTKGAELRFIRDIIAESGLRTRLVDVSTSGKASDLRRLRAGNRPEPRPRRIERVRRRPRRIGDGDGGCLCQLAAPPGQCRRHHLRGRLGRRFAGRARHARPARRRAEDDHLVGGLGRRRPLCRTCRHHHDVFGDRRAGPQFDLARGARQRRQRARRHGQGAPRRARRPGNAMRAPAFPRSASPCSA